MLFLLIGTGVTAFVTYRYVASQVQNYTSAEPVVLPSVEYSEQELEELGTRIHAFKENAGNADEPLEIRLSADDINALINSDTDMKGKAFVKINGDLIQCDVSIPLDDFPLAKGRYLNGSATVELRMINGELAIYVREISVNGQPLPEVISTSFENQDFGASLRKDKELAEPLSRLKDFRVEDGSVVLELYPSMGHKEHDAN